MYKLSVPLRLLQIERYGAEPFINELKKIGADVVILALGCYETNKEKQKKIFDALRKNVPIFKQAGFTVCAWLWSFMMTAENGYTHITSPTGKVSRDQICPSDEAFCTFAYEYIQSIADCKPDMIMFDDDFRYGFIDCGLGCACKNHRAYIEKELGERLPEGNVAELIFGGEKNKYRSAFLKANGHYLREFARMSRAAVDSVDPNIRLGLCACMTTWDFDGVSAAELSRIMAGSTKPFLRLIGAPYWSNRRLWGNRVQDTIELERMESSWCGDDIELFAEGDSFSRPRFTCPANVLEGFDMAIRASGVTDGIQKYTLDYFSDVEYERGYNEKHIENQEIYKKIDEHFSDKSPVGVRVYENMTKFEDMDVPYSHYASDPDKVEEIFFSCAARMLSAQTIPSVYEGLGTVGIAFGDNAKYLDDGALENGMILDAHAAEILRKRGVDVGLSSIGEEYIAAEEYFPEQNRYVNLRNCPVLDVKVKDGVRIESFFVNGERKSVGTYSYTNAAGQSFLIFAFDGYRMSDHAFKQYARGQQIEKWIVSLDKTLPASMHGNPDCYMLCKKNETGMAVWIGNFFADECMNTTVKLDGEYREIEFINCTGRLEGDTVELDYVAPYASVGFAVKL